MRVVSIFMLSTCTLALGQGKQSGTGLQSCQDTQVTAEACDGDTLYKCNCLETKTIAMRFRHNPQPVVSVFALPTPFTTYSTELCQDSSDFEFVPGPDEGEFTIYRVDITCEAEEQTHISSEDSQSSICDQISAAIMPEPCEGQCANEGDECELWDFHVFEHEYTSDEDEDKQCCIVTEVNDCECI